MNDPFELERFMSAQDLVFHKVVAELTNGKKQSHWMWYVFPQIDGLGRSAIARKYAISGILEAKAYLAEPVLAGRLNQCCELLLAIEKKNAREVLGSPDDSKLRSCMTMFSVASETNLIFQLILDKYFASKADPLTLAILSN
jgi:uncharacterized protein (DUF1810 family)